MAPVIKMLTHQPSQARRKKVGFCFTFTDVILLKQGVTIVKPDGSFQAFVYIPMVWLITLSVGLN